MINLELIRNQPDRVRSAIEKRGEQIPIEPILKLDRRRRSAIATADELRSRRNAASKEIGQSKQRDSRLINEMRHVGTQIKSLEEEIRGVEEELRALMLMIPNIPDDDVPPGHDESCNVVVRSTDELPSFDFVPLPHWELGERLDIIDFERGVKMAGSRFYVLKGKGARLQRALISWMLDIHAEEHGYQELYLPNLVNRNTGIASGQLPKFSDNMYHDEVDDFWLVPTAEVPITGMYAGEILDQECLPLNYVAHTPCFRREKASAGRDTRGIKRVHQFEKVEMYKIVEPETSSDHLEELVKDAEDICVRLGVPHRVIQLCSGELGVVASKTYDIEMWSAGTGEWLEVSSCSNCVDFQSRRANIRYKSQAMPRPVYPHTLNGSGLALPRVLIAVLENNQLSDGSVCVPEVLQPYAGFAKIG